MVAATAAPAFAASCDVELVRDFCDETYPWPGLNHLHYKVCATAGGNLAAGSVFTWEFSGANSDPIFSGTLVDNSSQVQDYHDVGLTGAKGWGSVTLTTTRALTSGTCWTATFSYDIGPAAKSRESCLTLTTAGSGSTNYDTNTDSACFKIARGSCNR